jgi:hypothetical protein
VGNAAAAAAAAAPRRGRLDPAAGWAGALLRAPPLGGAVSLILNVAAGVLTGKEFGAPLVDL